MRFMSGDEYTTILKKYEDSLHGFRQSIFTSQTEHMEGLRKDFAGLENEIAQTKTRLLEETRLLESGIQLDLNLEIKRRAETRTEIEKRTEETASYEKEKMNDLRDGLNDVSKQAKAAILGISFSSVVCFLI
jgi:hypothetical protein